MTFILSKRYPDRATAPDEKNIRGRMKNRSTPDSQDGSYLEQDWTNDDRAFPDTILLKAGVAPNGNVDTAGNSQVYDALISIITKMINTNSVPMIGDAVGTADSFSASFPLPVQLVDGFQVFVRAAIPNSSTTPRFNAGGTGARQVVKGHNIPLLIGDISGAGHILHLVFSQAINRWVLLNPAYGVSQPESIPVGTIAYFGREGDIPGWLPLTGGEYSRAQFQRLVESCPRLIRSGSNNSTFRLVDARGYFPRVLDMGRGIDGGRVLGSLQDDAIRNIWGNSIQLQNDRDFGNRSGGAFYSLNYGGGRTDGGNGRDTCTQLCFDASRVVPVANENRPKNIAFPLYVKY